MPRVRTPQIHWDFTSRRVLCMEWIEGVKLTDKAAMQVRLRLPMLMLMLLPRGGWAGAL
jgi:hypothetical protein